MVERKRRGRGRPHKIQSNLDIDEMLYGDALHGGKEKDIEEGLVADAEATSGSTADGSSIIDPPIQHDENGLDAKGVDVTYQHLKNYEFNPMEDPRDTSTRDETKISFKDLVRYTADSCDYYTYEVEDVLRHFQMVLRWLVVDQKKEVYVRGLGTFHETTKPAKVMQSTFDGKYYFVPAKTRLTMRSDPKISDFLNPGRPKGVTYPVDPSEFDTVYAAYPIDGIRTHGLHEKPEKKLKRHEIENWIPYNETEEFKVLMEKKKEFLRKRAAERKAKADARKAERRKALDQAAIRYAERKIQERLEAGPDIPE